jgi:exodeoxyribonuclease VII small subunit
MNIESDLKKLEETVAKMESKSLSIGESLKLYNQAVELSRALIESLNLAKGKLSKLNKELDRVDIEEN